MFKIKASLINLILQNIETYGHTNQLTQEQKKIYKQYRQAQKDKIKIKIEKDDKRY